ncbi:hypothetical protein AVEN_50942-1 [Araneus ventricosus]|uniref:Uncharacterized protein n=1 Tax=Araneus ventricosus TaxID=182803 RepID=A0A4Y2LC07_ARAVE|nr:hypothetical protein AVEN_50942-1 [Araneus ventricosus]
MREPRWPVGKVSASMPEDFRLKNPLWSMLNLMWRAKCPSSEHGLLRKSELTVRVSLLPVAESIDKHLSSASGKISSRNFSPRHETQEGEYSSEQKRPGSSILFGNDWIKIFIL